jgi:hypothetical protein
MSEDDRWEGLEDEDFDEALITGELAPFWKPEVEGEVRIAEVGRVRKTKDFGDGAGEAVTLRGAEGVYALPISAGLADVDWPAQRGRVFRFKFLGWFDFERDSVKYRMRKFEVKKRKGDQIPF